MGKLIGILSEVTLEQIGTVSFALMFPVAAVLLKARQHVSLKEVRDVYHG